MTATVAESLIPHLSCDGFGFDCELLTACARVGIPLIEVPVCVHYDGKTSTTSPRSGVQMLRELWRIRRSWRKKNIQMITIAETSIPDVTRTRPPAAA
jgi:hypothetical protein